MNIAFIPARCGSKSIRLKNIKLFCGKPLIYWNLKALSDSLLIDEIIVATDCLEIQKVVESFLFNKVKVYKRDKKNSKDSSSTESVMLEFINKNNFDDNDKFILVQATSPLTETKDFDNALLKINNNKCDSLLTCVRLKRFIWDENNKPMNYSYNKRPRRQDFKGLLVENGAFYINNIKNIKKYKNRLSGNISIYEMDEYKSIEIDEESDWIIAEGLMNKFLLNNNKKNKNYKKIKLFLSDVDGTLTDSGMYYSNSGDELKKFNTHDGMGFELLRKAGIKTGIITSENTKIVEKRSKKLKVDYVFQDKKNKGKLNIALDICNSEGITLDNIAYIGDDLNCISLLQQVGIKACPSDSIKKVIEIPGIMKMKKKGGEGCVREFIEIILNID
tara:strand:+ start:138 stop:1304 length:1167 start_codon:yes stop_codon:yes gene_type:complete